MMGFSIQDLVDIEDKVTVVAKDITNKPKALESVHSNNTTKMAEKGLKNRLKTRHRIISLHMS